MADIFDISFVGQDFQPLDDAVKRAKISCDGDTYYLNYANEMCKGETQQDGCNLYAYRRILDKLLYELAPGGKVSSDLLHINVSQEANKRQNQQTLYSPDFVVGDKRGYFGGIVGVVKKQIKMNFDADMGVQSEFRATRQYMFNVTLQIKSRLDVDENGEPGRPFFLSTMLLRNNLQLNDLTVPNSEDELFDYLLLFWYKEQLQEACLKGYYKTYRHFSGNDDKPRGTIDVARHIKINMGQENGKIAYTYRENTINNYLNHMVVAAYDHLKNKYYDLVVENFDSNVDLKKTIDFLRNQIRYSNSNVCMLIGKNIKEIAHPFYTEYEQLRVTCMKILRDEGISLFDGVSEQDTKGILFYLPDLWELYLKEEVIDYALPEDVACNTQEAVWNFGFLTENHEYEYKQPTYPDFVLHMKNDKYHPFMIFDAKFKPAWEGVLAEKGCTVSAVMEDYNKCLRDMVAINAKATGVIFPTNQPVEMNDRILKHAVSQYNPNTYFFTVPIQVPVVDHKISYFEWKKCYEEKLQACILTIKDIISEEKDY